MLPLGDTSTRTPTGHTNCSLDGTDGGNCPTWPKPVLETDYKALADMTVSYFQPFKQTLEANDTGSTTDGHQHTHSTPDQEDQDLDYAELQGAVTVARTIKRPTEAFKQQPGTVLFKFTIKVGDLYAHREATFSNQGDIGTK